MSRWTDADTAIRPAGGKNWEVTDELVWEVGRLGSGNCVTVPVGFQTDLGSIPRPFWSIILPHGQPQLQACVAHDYLYRTPSGRVPNCQSKREVDREFRHMMVALETPTLRVWTMWAAVRVAFWAGTW